MAHYSQEIREKARKAYIFDKLSLASVSLTIDVPYQTVARWKKQAAEKGDDWDKLKAAHTLAGGDLESMARQILTDLVAQFKATMEIVQHQEGLSAFERVSLLTSLSDSYHKAVSASRKLLPETSKLAVAFEVLEKLGEYMKQHKPELLMEFAAVLEPFGELLEKELK